MLIHNIVKSKSLHYNDNLASIGELIPNKENHPRPTYFEMISWLENLDQHRNWFPNQSDKTLSMLTLHIAFFLPAAKTIS
ncbi:hypothetical protein SADUNF_Sadunf14G0123900 [Salix dunnii]|uniref:Uncharacterized protein n=1 Tax=Salix dunnii TaxID=1413687 RepID=A0A835JHN0_9ROSI|nr:hypothetical protein SADUNF_Sadunf14G0123900 [Salix dunnii]